MLVTVLCWLSLFAVTVGVAVVPLSICCLGVTWWGAVNVSPWALAFTLSFESKVIVSILFDQLSGREIINTEHNNMLLVLTN